MRKMALITVANNIDQSYIDRFVSFCRQSDRHFPFDIWVGSHVDPKQTFCKPTILNDLLRKILGTYQVIVQTDIDMLIPPKLIADTYDYCFQLNSCIHCTFRYVESNEVKKTPYKNLPWDRFLARPPQRASGSWNGMTRELWKASGGFCEAIYNLGGPDSEFYLRTSKNKIPWWVTDSYPLAHINHPRRRVPRQGQKNMSRARKYDPTTNWLKTRNNDICPTNILCFSSKGTI